VHAVRWRLMGKCGTVQELRMFCWLGVCAWQEKCGMREFIILRKVRLLFVSYFV
jgi:hypothetical protein